MSHLIQITTAGELNTLDYDDTHDNESLPQLLDALSFDREVTTLTAVPHNRGENITIWIDDEALLHNHPVLNFTASAYAGHTLVGTVVISGFNPATGDTVGLTPDQVDAQTSAILRTSERVSTRLKALVRTGIA